MVKATPRPLNHRERAPLPILQKVGWAVRPVWRGAEISHPTGIRFLHLCIHYIYIYTHTHTHTHSICIIERYTVHVPVYKHNVSLCTGNRSSCTRCVHGLATDLVFKCWKVLLLSDCHQRWTRCCSMYHFRFPVDYLGPSSRIPNPLPSYRGFNQGTSTVRDHVKLHNKTSEVCMFRILTSRVELCSEKVLVIGSVTTTVQGINIFNRRSLCYCPCL
jgi:hypothetical protein